MRYFVLTANLIALLFIAVNIGSAAAQQQYSCPNPDHDYRMPDCPIVLFEAADSEMKAAYQQALDEARKQDAVWEPAHMRKFESSLRASQEAWEAFRAAECNWHAFLEFPGGSGFAPGKANCATKMAKERTKVLKGQ